MLPQKVTIIGASGGPGTYTATLAFSNTPIAIYLRVGDQLTDRLGNRYSITTWTAHPDDFVNASVATMTFVDNDIAPANFSAVGDATVETLGAVDVRPAVQSLGTIFTNPVFSGQNFEYEFTASWFDSSANDAIVGDCILDLGGKKYVITNVSGASLSSGRVKEVEEEGKPPDLGQAALFRPTPNFGFQQPLFTSDDSHLFSQNRDTFLIDKKLQDINVGSDDDAIDETYDNNSGATILELTPVRSDGGNLEKIDPSVESEVTKIIGVTTQSISNASSGIVVLSGLVKNISTSIPLDSRVFLSKTGTITDTIPDIGVGGFVEGDFLVQIGWITENRNIPSNKDLMVDIKIIAQM